LKSRKKRGSMVNLTQRVSSMLSPLLEVALKTYIFLRLTRLKAEMIVLLKPRGDRSLMRSRFSRKKAKKRSFLISLILSPSTMPARLNEPT